jgi:DMSO/TMAO reductase YedYZ molybdopterin-dependent catalytic subunit
VDRRAFIRAGTVGPVVGWSALASRRGLAQEQAAATGAGQPAGPAAEPAPARIVRQEVPQNLESPFHLLDGPITPVERFYVRNHFPVPRLDPAAYRLRIEGAVERPCELSLAELRQLPATTRTLTLECAGNGRVFLNPSVRGVQWGLGAVSTAEWTGVPLGSVLERVGVRPEAVAVVLEGADRGVVAEPASPGPISYARSLPLAKARRPEVLLAYRMNGADLLPAHGFPLRAVVGGWYGMASVKWLVRIVVVDRPFAGFWETFDYSEFRLRDGLPEMVPITGGQVKSAIARPVMGEVVRGGAEYRIYGAAWAGEHDVVRVEVSTDNGASWHVARLLGERVPFAWRLWEWTWRVQRQAGEARLLVRATDSANRTQPRDRDPNYRTYSIHHLIPTVVTIRV